METVQPRDDKSPVVNITSQSATPVGGQGERSKEHLIDPPSKPGSQVDSPATADYTAIQIDQEDTVSHEAQKDTNDDSETLAVNPFSNLAHYSILRHQETLASWEKQLQERGSLDETEVQSLRETLRIYCML